LARAEEAVGVYLPRRRSQLPDTFASTAFRITLPAEHDQLTSNATEH
jgi:hypothetical protein